MIRSVNETLDVFIALTQKTYILRLLLWLCIRGKQNLHFFNLSV